MKLGPIDFLASAPTHDDHDLVAGVDHIYELANYPAARRLANEVHRLLAVVTGLIPRGRRRHAT